MSHARIEEVSDSDSDPSEGNISDLEDDFDEREILKARPSQVPTLQDAPKHLIDPSSVPGSHTPKTTIGSDGTQFQSTTDDSKYKDYQCIYPVYFDKTRSRAEGRRVGVENAVENPLAREVVAACMTLGLESLFEPAKLHPKDWSNPGRVKVKLKGGRNPTIKNKHHLYTLIAEHLKAHPTTTEAAQRVRIPGAPLPDPNKPYPEPAAPRGWKMGRIVPYYSPAVTGGGVSEDFFKDMMKEMQGQMPGHPALGGADSGSGSGAPSIPKKQKKKIIRV